MIAFCNDVFKIKINPATPHEYIINEPSRIPIIGLFANCPIAYAARKNPTIYPIVGLLRIAKPATPAEKNGRPDSPINRYINMLIAPKVLPKTRPANKTTNVCPVIGTGDIGITIRICALKAVTIAKPS